jgi:hypothetical protein
MCTIPLDLERRFEQRWAARFSGALQEHREEHREKQRQHLTAPDESKEKPAGLSWSLGRRRVSGRPGIARIAK